MMKGKRRMEIRFTVTALSVTAFTLTAFAVTSFTLVTGPAYGADDFASGGRSAVEATAGRQGSGTQDPGLGTTRGMSDTTENSTKTAQRASDVVGTSKSGVKAPSADERASSAKEDLVTQAKRRKNHGTLVKAIEAAQLEKTLRNKGPYTVFAPTDAAFGALPTGTVSSMMEPSGREELKALLSYHIVPGNFDSALIRQMIDSSASKRLEMTTLNGSKLYATIEDGDVMLQDSRGEKSRVVLPDGFARNGVIHDIDQVVKPESMADKKPMIRGPVHSE